MPLYASVSKLDSFHGVLVGDAPWEEDAVLVEDIKNPTPAGWQALWGSALHGCIEAPDKWRQPDGSYLWTDERSGKSVSLPASIVDPCAGAWPKGSVFERPAYKDYYAHGRTLKVSSRVDSFRGLGIIEGKTKLGRLDLSDYYDSFQWRLYLDMNPWAQYVEYRIHEIGGVRNEGGVPVVSKDGLELKDIHVFRCWRQPGNDELCQALVEKFVEWAVQRGLEPWLVPFSERPAA